MTALNGAAALKLVPAVAPAPRRRRRRGGRRNRARRLAAAAPALEALAEFRQLADVERICLALGPLDPIFPRIAARARQAQLARVRLLDQIGIHPRYLAKPEATINGEVYALDDRLAVVVDELLTVELDSLTLELLTPASADAANPTEVAMQTATTTAPKTTLEMNGQQALQPAQSFFGRIAEVGAGIFGSLRLPTAKEALIGGAVIVILGAVVAAIADPGDVVDVTPAA